MKIIATIIIFVFTMQQIAYPAPGITPERRDRSALRPAAANKAALAMEHLTVSLSSEDNVEVPILIVKDILKALNKQLKDIRELPKKKRKKVTADEINPIKKKRDFWKTRLIEKAKPECRLAEFRDIDAIVEVHNAMWAKTPEGPITREQVRVLLEMDPPGCIVLEVETDNGKRIAAAMFSIDVNTRGNMYYTLPDTLAELISHWRFTNHNPAGDTRVCFVITSPIEGLGMAEELVLFQRQIAIQDGKEHLVTYSPANARTFHEGKGAVCVREIENGRYSGMDAVVMQYALTPEQEEQLRLKSRLLAAAPDYIKEKREYLEREGLSTSAEQIANQLLEAHSTEWQELEKIFKEKKYTVTRNKDIGLIHFQIPSFGNIAAIEYDGGYVLLDSGSRRGFKELVLPMLEEEEGITPDNIKLSAVTHSHFDHVGGALDLASRDDIPIRIHRLAQSELNRHAEWREASRGTFEQILNKHQSERRLFNALRKNELIGYFGEKRGLEKIPTITIPGKNPADYNVLEEIPVSPELTLLVVQTLADAEGDGSVKTHAKDQVYFYIQDNSTKTIVASFLGDSLSRSGPMTESSLATFFARIVKGQYGQYAARKFGRSGGWNPNDEDTKDKEVNWSSYFRWDFPAHGPAQIINQLRRCVDYESFLSELEATWDFISHDEYWSAKFKTRSAVVRKIIEFTPDDDVDKETKESIKARLKGFLEKYEKDIGQPEDAVLELPDDGSRGGTIFYPEDAYKNMYRLAAATDLGGNSKGANSELHKDAIELRSTKEALGFSEEEFAKKLGVNRKTVWWWKNAKVGFRSTLPDKLVALRRIYQKLTPKMVRSMRKALGLSQTGLVEELRVNPRTIQKWESQRKGTASIPPDKLITLRRKYYAEMVRSMREALKLSQRELAEELGVNRTTIQKWESHEEGTSSIPPDKLIILRRKYKELTPNMVKSRREALGLSQQQLGKLLHVSKFDVYQWEHERKGLSDIPPDKLITLHEHYQKFTPGIIRSMRKALGFTQKGLGILLVVNESVIQEWEKQEEGTTSIPPDKLIILRRKYKELASNMVRPMRKVLGLSQEKLAKKLGVSRSTLYGWERSKVRTSTIPIDRLIALRKIYQEFTSRMVRSMRKELGFTLEELGSQLDVDPHIIPRWEDGRRQIPPNEFMSLRNLWDEDKPQAPIRALIFTGTIQTYDETLGRNKEFLTLQNKIMFYDVPAEYLVYIIDEIKKRLGISIYMVVKGNGNKDKYVYPDKESILAMNIGLDDDIVFCASGDVDEDILEGVLSGVIKGFFSLDYLSEDYRQEIVAADKDRIEGYIEELEEAMIQESQLGFGTGAAGTAAVLMGLAFVFVFAPQLITFAQGMLGYFAAAGVGGVLVLGFGGVKEEASPKEGKEVNENITLEDLRAQVFGEGINEWVASVDTRYGDRHKVKEAAVKIARDKNFLGFATSEGSDFVLKLIRHCLNPENKIDSLGTGSLQIFLDAVRRNIDNKQVRDKIQILYNIRVVDFVDLRAALAHPDIKRSIKSKSYDSRKALVEASQTVLSNMQRLSGTMAKNKSALRAALPPRLKSTLPPLPPRPKAQKAPPEPYLGVRWALGELEPEQDLVQAARAFLAPIILGEKIPPAFKREGITFRRAKRSCFYKVVGYMIAQNQNLARHINNKWDQEYIDSLREKLGKEEKSRDLNTLLFHPVMIDGLCEQIEKSPLKEWSAGDIEIVWLERLKGMDWMLNPEHRERVEELWFRLIVWRLTKSAGGSELLFEEGAEWREIIKPSLQILEAQERETILGFLNSRPRGDINFSKLRDELKSELSVLTTLENLRCMFYEAILSNESLALMPIEAGNLTAILQNMGVLSLDEDAISPEAEESYARLISGRSVGELERFLPELRETITVPGDKILPTETLALADWEGLKKHAAGHNDDLATVIGEIKESVDRALKTVSEMRKNAKEDLRTEAEARVLRVEEEEVEAEQKDKTSDVELPKVFADIISRGTISKEKLEFIFDLIADVAGVSRAKIIYLCERIGNIGVPHRRRMMQRFREMAKFSKEKKIPEKKLLNMWFEFANAGLLNDYEGEVIYPLLVESGGKQIAVELGSMRKLLKESKESATGDKETDMDMKSSKDAYNADADFRNFSEDGSHKNNPSSASDMLEPILWLQEHIPLLLQWGYDFVFWIFDSLSGLVLGFGGVFKPIVEAKLINGTEVWRDGEKIAEYKGNIPDDELSQLDGATIRRKLTAARKLFLGQDRSKRQVHNFSKYGGRLIEADIKQGFPVKVRFYKKDPRDGFEPEDEEGVLSQLVDAKTGKIVHTWTVAGKLQLPRFKKILKKHPKLILKNHRLSSNGMLKFARKQEWAKFQKTFEGRLVDADIEMGAKGPVMTEARIYKENPEEGFDGEPKVFTQLVDKGTGKIVYTHWGSILSTKLDLFTRKHTSLILKQHRLTGGGMLNYGGKSHIAIFGEEYADRLIEVNIESGLDDWFVTEVKIYKENPEEGFDGKPRVFQQLLDRDKKRKIVYTSWGPTWSATVMEIAKKYPHLVLTKFWLDDDGVFRFAGIPTIATFMNYPNRLIEVNIERGLDDWFVTEVKIYKENPEEGFDGVSHIFSKLIDRATSKIVATWHKILHPETYRKIADKYPKLLFTQQLTKRGELRLGALGVTRSYKPFPRYNIEAKIDGNDFSCPYFIWHEDGEELKSRTGPGFGKTRINLFEDEKKFKNELIQGLNKHGMPPEQGKKIIDTLIRLHKSSLDILVEHKLITEKTRKGINDLNLKGINIKELAENLKRNLARYKELGLTDLQVGVIVNNHLLPAGYIEYLRRTYPSARTKVIFMQSLFFPEPEAYIKKRSESLAKAGTFDSEKHLRLRTPNTPRALSRGQRRKLLEELEMHKRILSILSEGESKKIECKNIGLRDGMHQLSVAGAEPLPIKLGDLLYVEDFPFKLRVTKINNKDNTFMVRDESGSGEILPNDLTLIRSPSGPTYPMQEKALGRITETLQKSGLKTTGFTAMDRVLKLVSDEAVADLDAQDEITFFDKKIPRKQETSNDGETVWTGDESHEAAVKLILSEGKIKIISGGAGTGKTTAVAEAIRQLVKQGKRVLLVSKMNQAVDNTLKEVMDDVPALRFGNDEEPIRRGGTISAWVRNPEAIRKFAEKQKHTDGLLFAATNIGIATDDLAKARLGEKDFDVVIMDEASCENLAGSLVPLQYLKDDGSLILLGDTKQLGTFRIRKEEERLEQAEIDKKDIDSFYNSILARLERQGIADEIDLCTGWRSHPLLTGLVSYAFYEGEIHQRGWEDFTSDVLNIRMIDREEDEGQYFERPVTEGYESEGEKSYQNERSADEVMNTLRYYIEEKRIEPDKITIITAYKPQADVLTRLINMAYSSKKPRISTVDSFQGGENDVVIVDLVRSNRHGEIGFIKDINRLNVALSRARDHMTIICDSRVFFKEPKEIPPEDVAARKALRRIRKYYMNEVWPFFPEELSPINGMGADTSKNSTAQTPQKASAMPELADFMLAVLDFLPALVLGFGGVKEDANPEDPNKNIKDKDFSIRLFLGQCIVPVVAMARAEKRILRILSNQALYKRSMLDKILIGIMALGFSSVLFLGIYYFGHPLMVFALAFAGFFSLAVAVCCAGVFILFTIGDMIDWKTINPVEAIRERKKVNKESDLSSKLRSYTSISYERRWEMAKELKETEVPLLEIAVKEKVGEHFDNALTLSSFDPQIFTQAVKSLSKLPTDLMFRIGADEHDEVIVTLVNQAIMDYFNRHIEAIEDKAPLSVLHEFIMALHQGYNSTHRLSDFLTRIVRELPEDEMLKLIRDTKKMSAEGNNEFNIIMSEVLEKLLEGYEDIVILTDNGEELGLIEIDFNGIEDFITSKIVERNKGRMWRRIKGALSIIREEFRLTREESHLRKALRRTLNGKESVPFNEYRHIQEEAAGRNIDFRKLALMLGYADVAGKRLIALGPAEDLEHYAKKFSDKFTSKALPQPPSSASDMLEPILWLQEHIPLLLQWGHDFISWLMEYLETLPGPLFFAASKKQKKDRHWKKDKEERRKRHSRQPRHSRESRALGLNQVRILIENTKILPDEMALEAFSAAPRKLRKDPLAMNEIASIHMRSGNYEKVEELSSECIKIIASKTNYANEWEKQFFLEQLTNAYTANTLAHLNLGRPKDALDAAIELIKLDLEAPQSHRLLARVIHSLGVKTFILKGLGPAQEFVSKVFAVLSDNKSLYTESFLNWLSYITEGKLNTFPQPVRISEDVINHIIEQHSYREGGAKGKGIYMTFFPKSFTDEDIRHWLDATLKTLSPLRVLPDGQEIDWLPGDLYISYSEDADSGELSRALVFGDNNGNVVTAFPSFGADITAWDGPKSRPLDSSHLVPSVPMVWNRKTEQPVPVKLSVGNRDSGFISMINNPLLSDLEPIEREQLILLTAVEGDPLMEMEDENHRYYKYEVPFSTWKERLATPAVVLKVSKESLRAIDILSLEEVNLDTVEVSRDTVAGVMNDMIKDATKIKGTSPNLFEALAQAA